MTRPGLVADPLPIDDGVGCGRPENHDDDEHDHARAVRNEYKCTLSSVADERDELLLRGGDVAARKGFMGPGSIISSVCNLSSSALGAGILSLPYAFRLSGLALGMVLLVVSALLTIYSVRLLVSCREATRMSTYEELALLCFGKPLSRLVDLSIVLFCFGCAVAYIVAAHDILAPIMMEFLPHHPWAHDKALVMLSSVVLVMFPLSLFDKMSSLRFPSLIGVASICYLAMAIAVDESMHFYREGAPSLALYLFRPGLGTFRSSSLIMFAFTCQVNVFSIYSELQRPSIRRIRKVVRRSTMIAAILYAVAGIFGFCRHLDATSPDILYDYQLKESPLLGVAQVAMGISLALAFPFNVHPARFTIERALFPNSRPSQVRFYGITSAIVFSAVAVAIFAPSIDRVFALVGSTTSAVVSFVLPGLFYLCIFPVPWSEGDGLGAVTLVVVGATLGVVGTVVELSDIAYS